MTATKSQMIRAQNQLNEWISIQMEENDLCREQIRYILTDKLNDMSKTDLYDELRKIPIQEGE